MKAWEVRESKLRLHDVADPRLGSGQSLIQVRHAGLCGSDLPKLLRPGDFALPEPWRPGHEIAGTDTEGRPVAVDPLIPCQACIRCTDGATHLCPDLRRIGWDLPGGFAEWIIVPAANARLLPDGLNFLTAVLADPAAVAIHGLRCNPVGPPGRLAVVGAGTVGLLTALYAHSQGWEVAVVHRAGRAPRDAVVQAVPATFHASTVLPSAESFDVVADTATGADPAPLEIALRLVSDGGTIVVQNAYHPGVQLPTSLRDLFRRSIRLIGSFSYCRSHELDDFAVALDFLRSHVNEVANLVAEVGWLADLSVSLGAHGTRGLRQVLTNPAF